MTDLLNESEGPAAPIDFVHQRVHDGLAYEISHLFTGVAASGVAEILLLIGATFQAHSAFEVSVEASATVELYRAPTITANGTGLTIHNLHEESARVSTQQAFHTPTIAAPGTQIKVRKAPGTTGALISIGSIVDSALRNTEIILAKSQNYLVRITNNAAGTQDLSITTIFYESNVTPIT